ncbi:MAG: hypothetical protein ABI430_03400 [Candidatus Taylorbacteria bacterium]
MKKEILLDKILATLPDKLRGQSDYDLVFRISEVCQDYDLSFGEVDELFGEACNILTGVSNMSTLSDRVNILLNPENKKSAEKITKEIVKIIEKLKSDLGDKFPLPMPVGEILTETHVKNRPSDGGPKKENDLDRDSILKGIENPEKVVEGREIAGEEMITPVRPPLPAQVGVPYTLSNPTPKGGVEVRPDMRPEEIYPQVQKVSEAVRFKVSGVSNEKREERVVGSIIDQKMSGITALPHKEEVIQPARPIQKSYERDPYREQTK